MFKCIDEYNGKNLTITVQNENCESIDILAQNQCTKDVGPEKQVGNCAAENLAIIAPNKIKLDQLIHDWRKAGIQVESDSQYAAPAMLAPKKNGELWPNFDYRLSIECSNSSRTIPNACC